MVQLDKGMYYLDDFHSYDSWLTFQFLYTLKTFEARRPSFSYVIYYDDRGSKQTPTKSQRCAVLRGLLIWERKGKVEITHLFFADDILLFYYPEDVASHNIRCILLCFEVESRLRINLEKSELVIIENNREASQKAYICSREHEPSNKVPGATICSKIQGDFNMDPVMSIFESRLAN